MRKQSLWIPPVCTIYQLQLHEEMVRDRLIVGLQNTLLSRAVTKVCQAEAIKVQQSLIRIDTTPIGNVRKFCQETQQNHGSGLRRTKERDHSVPPMINISALLKMLPAISARRRATFKSLPITAQMGVCESSQQQSDKVTHGAFLGAIWTAQRGSEWSLHGLLHPYRSRGNC